MAKRKRTKRSYSDEFKREAIRLLENRGDSTVAEVAASISVKPSQLYEWKRAFAPEPAPPVEGESAEQEVQRLRREVSRMQKENETLKKSIALFVKDLKL